MDDHCLPAVQTYFRRLQQYIPPTLAEYINPIAGAYDPKQHVKKQAQVLNKFDTPHVYKKKEIPKLSHK
jgi:hypothetical protein